MKKRVIKKTIYTMIFITSLCAIIYCLFRMYQNIEITENYTTKKVKQSTIQEQTVEAILEKSQNIADVIEKVTKSVCGISKLSNAGGSILSIATASELGLGTGIIVSSNGYILSNAHVTGEKYSTCYVKIEDKDTYTGTVVWADSDLDLSITKVNAKNLEEANLGTSKDIRIGETVYAIGNPIGYEFRRTVTSGIISAINRTVKLEENIYMSDLIQTDATINPGNSGGPLINPKGEVIGINSVKITSAEGIGFAVPVDVVKPVIESYVKKGKFEEANLGLYVYDESVSQYINKQNQYIKGISISQIMKDGPAFGKGIKEDDVITKIDDKRLNTINDLKEYLYTKKPGDIVKLNIDNGRYEKEIEIELSK